MVEAHLRAQQAPEDDFEAQLQAYEDAAQQEPDVSEPTSAPDYADFASFGEPELPEPEDDPYYREEVPF